MQRSDCLQGGGRGGRRQRTCLARRVEVAAVCRHSWFLTEEAQMEVQVLLPAAVCCYHSSQHCCSDSPGAAAPQHSQTPTLYCTYTHFFFQLLWQAVQEEGSDESTAPRPEPRDKLTCWWNTHILTHTLLERTEHQGSCMNGTEKKKGRCSNNKCQVRLKRLCAGTECWMCSINNRSC